MSNLVYSSETGSTCPQCKKDLRKCKCSPGAITPISKGDGVVRVGRETKGRSGSGVTTISGLDLSESDLKDFAKMLKNQCGTGGTIKLGIIEIQGDHRDKIIEILKAKSLKVKRVGG